MTDGEDRPRRVHATRELILVTAERLFAEHGVHEVSNRQISQAAGQGNNTAVGYHFGTKTDLVRAIARKHSERIEQRRSELLAAAEGSTDVRAWVSCLVRPATDHFATLGVPSWLARFNAQLMNDPSLREVMIEESLTSPTLRRILDGLNACLAGLPLPVRLERGDMARHLIVQMCAEYERALAEGTPTARAGWPEMATGLIDGIVGLWTAPVSGNLTAEGLR
ncbi:TetR family transcriptional regulator [Kribbella amoyensis]|uniref:TetR family transcriptional regulator n=1 Tax=Kribbella amoyensis TaxID=996641 RepID=A0A561C0Q7_9ACTN|nr:TetR/AcrR family transcriptional regulator [Kribbella amoyensis]TWD84684.1 TetR family transcriptional regulator [Kribbella amoyensis]